MSEAAVLYEVVGGPLVRIHDITHPDQQEVFEVGAFVEPTETELQFFPDRFRLAGSAPKEASKPQAKLTRRRPKV